MISNIKCPYCGNATLEPYKKAGRYYAKCKCSKHSTSILTTHRDGKNIVVDAATRIGRRPGEWGMGKSEIVSVRYNPAYMGGKTPQQVIDEHQLTIRKKSL